MLSSIGITLQLVFNRKCNSLATDELWKSISMKLTVSPELSKEIFYKYFNPLIVINMPTCRVNGKIVKS